MLYVRYEQILFMLSQMDYQEFPNFCNFFIE